MLIVMSLILGANVFLASAARAADEGGAGSGAYLMQGVSPGCIGTGNCTPCDLIQVGVNASDMIVSFSGAIAILMFIIGGIIMITAYGSDRITMGKNIIIATLVGLLIIFASWTLVNTLVFAFYGSSPSGAFPSALSAMTKSSSLQTYKCGGQ